MEIFNNKKYLSVHFHKELNYLRFSWKHMAIPLEPLKEMFLEATKFIEKNNVETLMADTSNAKSILFPECIEWWENHQAKLASIGVNKIITITSGSALTRSTNRKWQSATGNIDLYEVSTLLDAEKIISK